jgi:hypothetical protein
MPTKDEIREFSAIIEKIVAEKNIGFMDAVVHHCEEIGFEVELAATLLTPPIKAKIGEEAQAINMMKKKVNRLPV